MLKHKNSQKKEIMWNLINSGLAGVLVLLGALTGGEISLRSICIALLTAVIVAVTQFKNYWQSEEKEYKSKRTYGLMKLL
jgi:hypothetical protein